VLSRPSLGRAKFRCVEDVAVDPDVVALAGRLAADAHAQQVDKAGRPYVEHLRRVAAYVNPSDLSAVAAALLHDVLEDTTTTPAQLLEQHLPADVVDTVQLLTRKPQQQAADYYREIRAHAMAREVKLADLADNTDPDRLAQLPEALRLRLVRKYADAYEALGAGLEDGRRRRAAVRGVNAGECADAPQT
jgi:(p)ppGpp synthase/HD superfamily hydrolase